MTTNPLIFCIDSRIEKPTLLYSRFQLGPIPKGHGLTVGNALRRILLSELPTISIIAARLQLGEGAFVPHEYSSIPGIQEATLDLLLNLRQIVLSTTTFSDEPVTGFLKVTGPKRVTAKDLKLPKHIQVVDSNQYICTINDGAELNANLLLGFGKAGQSFVDLHPKKDSFSQKSNFFRLEPNFQPIKQLNYKIEDNLVQFDKRKTQSEQIILEIYTNGSIHPFQAVMKGLKELQGLFNLIQITPFYRDLEKGVKTISHLESRPSDLLGVETSGQPKLYFTSPLRKRLCSFDLANFQFSLDTFIELKTQNLHTIGDLLTMEPNGVKRRLTKPAFDEVQNLLNKLGIQNTKKTLQ